MATQFSDPWRKDTWRKNITAILACGLMLGVITGCKHNPSMQKQRYLESGKRYESEGKYKEASIQFANALKVDPNFSDAHYEMGKTYMHLGLMQAAFNELESTVSSTPTNMDARLELGKLALAGHQPDVAVE